MRCNTSPVGIGIRWFATMVLLFAAAELPRPGRSQPAELPIDQPSQTFTVTSVSNSGAGTLRQAITDANNNAGLDTIAFNLGGAGIRIIDISSVLPTITSPVIIDGTTQPGYAGTPLVFIRANGTSEAMKITAGGSTLTGLTFGNFDGTTTDGAINFSTNGGNIVVACTFGVLGDSTFDRNSNEVLVIDGITNNRIGGSTPAERNYFGADTFNRGVVIRNGASNNRVVGNWFGVAPNGTAIPHRLAVNIQNSPNNTVGGMTGVTPGGACTGECNVIAGNDDTIGGVQVTGATATGNAVIGNFVGLLADGQTVHRNRIAGVRISNAPNNRVGGTTAAERNVITGNGLAGVIVDGASSAGNVISGNYIGLRTDGVGTTTTTPTTSSEGVLLNPGSSATRIGGTTAGERNIISGNRIGVFSSQSSGNVVQGNYIGTDVTGMIRSTTLSHGVWLDGGSNNTIGGTAGTTLGGACTGACNVISGNGTDGASDGVRLSTAATGNTIDGNYIGLNALGTATILNGRTTDGSTFNGNAIRLIGSNGNIIGRQTAPPLARPIFERPGSTALIYCIQDDRTHDYIKFDTDPPKIIEARRCRGGYLEERRGTFSSGPDFLKVDVIAAGSGQPTVRTTVKADGSGFGDAYFYDGSTSIASFGVKDSDVSDSTCVCPPSPGDQMCAGKIRLDTNDTDIGRNVMGETADGLTPLPDVCVAESSCVAEFCNDCTMENLEIATCEESPVELQQGTGTAIIDILTTQTAGVLPIHILPGANDNIPAPTIDVDMLGDGSYRFVLNLDGGPPNTTLTYDYYGERVFDDPNDPRPAGDLVENPFPLPFDDTPFTTDENGDDETIFIVTQPEASEIDIRESISVIAQKIFGSGGPHAAGVTVGSTSPMSAPARVPKPPFDFDHDGKTDVAVYRAGATSGAESSWYILNSSNDSVRIARFGSGEDRIVPGEYHGDRRSDLTVFRPSTGYWYVAKPTGTPAQDFETIQFGLASDIPVQGDFDDDGRNDAAVFRPSEGTWYINDSLSGMLTARQWGVATDKLVPADYNGDGRTELAIYRNGTWWISPCAACPARSEQFGLAGDIPVPGDYDSDGKADIAVWRPSSGIWYIMQSTAGFTAVQWGVAGDKVLNGDFDGDGKNDIAVWRPSNGIWYILRSELGFHAIQWGQNGDISVPAFPNQ